MISLSLNLVLRLLVGLDEISLISLKRLAKGKKEEKTKFIVPCAKCLRILKLILNFMRRSVEVGVITNFLITLKSPNLQN